MNFARAFLFTGLLASCCFGQEFEVASVRPSAPFTPGQGAAGGTHLDGAHFRGLSLSVKDYISIAWQIRVDQVSGPDWITSERFDISATLPAGSTQAQIAKMLQALLADRFQLKTHQEKRDFPVYVLLTGKPTLKLKEAPTENVPDDSPSKEAVDVTGAGSAAGIGVDLGHGAAYSFADNRFDGHRMTMADLARNLERFADRPITDMTGLNGRYDFVLTFSPEDYRALLIRAAIRAGVMLPPEALRALDTSSAGALPDAVQQLGLRLESRKSPLDVLVIDDGQKTPAEN